MKLSNLTEARYAGPKTYIVQIFDPEEGLLDEFGGPFSTLAEAKKFADELYKEVIQVATLGDVNDLWHFNVEEVSSPDVFRNFVLEETKEQYGEI